MSKEFSMSSTPSKRKEKERPMSSTSKRQHTTGSFDNRGVTSSKVQWCPKRITTNDHSYLGIGNKLEKLGDVPNTELVSEVDVSRLTDDLTKIIFQNETSYSTGKRPASCQNASNASAVTGPELIRQKKGLTLIDETQTQQIKQILVNCLQNMDRNSDDSGKDKPELKTFCRKSYVKPDKLVTVNENFPKFSRIGGPTSIPMDATHKTSLLRSYLSGSNPAREEYISKRSNVSNSMISSDSIHHSIFLESGRERRQCLLQYLSNVISDGQVVIYVNSIPGAEALTSFLKKHNFPVNAVHSRLLLAESNWILSEFSMRRFSVLICAEDHYHSCPAHFRWVKTIINYELPIGNPLENWSIRNGIVEFSDNLPVHIYTFIKKLCPLDHELVKLLRLDSQEDQEILPKKL